MPFLGLLLVGLVASGLMAAFPPPLRFLVVFAVFSYLPGEVILRWAAPGRWRAAEVRLPLAAIMGLGAFAAAGWVCSLFGVGFRSYVAILQGMAACIFAAGLWLPRARALSAAPAQPRRPGPTLYRGALLAAALCMFLFFSFFPPAIDPRGDALVHLGYIRGITVENRLEPDDVLAPAVFAERGPTGGDPRRGALHPLLAAVSTLATLEPEEAWRRLPGVLAPAALLAFAAFASALLPSAGFAIGALALFLMFQGGIARQFFAVIAYGQHLSLVFYWLLVVMSLEYASAPAKRVLAAIFLTCLGGALAHVGVAIHTGLMVAGMLLFHRKFGFSSRSVLRLGLALAAACTIAVGWKLATAGGEANLLHSHPQGLMYFGDIGSRFFVPSPAEIIRRNGLVFFAGLLLIPFLLLVVRHGRYGRYGWMNLALALPPCVIALNPLTAPLVYDKGTYLLHRFVLNIPSFAITVLVVGSVVVWGRRGAVWKKMLAALFLLAWARPFVVSTNAWYADARSFGSERDGIGSVEDLRSGLAEVIRLINERLPEGSVVVSDPVTSYVLSAFSGARVVAVLHQHGNPRDPYPFERLSAVHAVMSPYTPQTMMMYALRKFGVEYIVVNGAFKVPYHDYLADWDPAFKAVLDEKIGALGEAFRPVLDTGDIAVYRVAAEDLRRTTWEPEIPFTRPPGEVVDPCESGAAAGSVRVVGLGANPRTVVPGERLRMTAVYRRGPGARPVLPPVLKLRFEDKTYFERAARFPGDKYVRRFLERRDGELRRFRIDRTPFEGRFRPEEWPEDADCYDVFEFRCPAAAVETTYEIEWRLVEEPLLPNFSVRDFIFNEDSYGGSPCTEIAVRRHVVR